MRDEDLLRDYLWKKHRISSPLQLCAPVVSWFEIIHVWSRTARFNPKLIEIIVNQGKREKVVNHNEI